MECATGLAWRRSKAAGSGSFSPPGRFQTSGTLPSEDSNSMIRGTSLAILALLAVVVLATGAVFAAPRQQAVDDATLSSLALSDVVIRCLLSTSGTTVVHRHRDAQPLRKRR